MMLLAEIGNATKRRNSGFEKEDALLREFKVQTPESDLLRDRSSLAMGTKRIWVVNFSLQSQVF